MGRMPRTVVRGGERITMTRTSERNHSPQLRPTPRRFYWALCIVTLCAATALADDKAAIVFIGGPVVTVNPDPDPRKQEVEALAIDDDGRIMAVGDRTSVLNKADASTQCLNLRGKTLMPGFVESHTHVVTTAYFQHLMKDLSSFALPTNPGTIDETVAALKKELADNPLYKTQKGKWLLAFGVDPSRARPFMASLDAEKLDRVQPGVAIEAQVPIFVMNQSEHIGYVNTRAIRLAGLTGRSPNPPGGVYVRTKENCDPKIEDCPLTGELHEAGAFKAFQDVIGADSANRPSDARWQEALETTYKSFAEAGVTTATELALGSALGVEKEFALLSKMVRRQLRIRAYMSAGAPGASVSARETLKRPDRDWLDLIGVKFVIDGSTQGLTGFLNDPYNYQQPPDTTNRGTSNYNKDSLEAAAEPYTWAGWQIAMHSNGDAALDHVLNVYESMMKSPRVLRDRRWRIEHLTVTREAQIARIRQLGLTASMTIGHVYFWGDAFGTDGVKTATAPAHKSILGTVRAQRIDPAKSLLGFDESKRVRFSFNSDSPVSPVSPLRYISTAVTRQEQQGPVLGSDQRITVDQAIRAVTLDAAYQLFLDDRIGSLELYKWADLVVLDGNPRAADMKPGEIMNIAVVATFVGGVQKYGSPLPSCYPPH
jgi:predicted amidohydrolase YtcJ